MHDTFVQVFLVALAVILDKATGLDVFSSPVLYDWGFYGLYPRVSYQSYEGKAPLLNFVQWSPDCDDGSHYFLTPRGTMVANPGPFIFDSKGDLVWTDSRFGVVTDLKVQSYKDKNYLTFWSGTDGIKYHYGRGTYYMLDETYEMFRSVQAVGEDLMGDLHDFKITKEGTALVTIYLNTPADLSPIGGRKTGWILDSIFQEIDIDSGALLFEWRASEHLDLGDSMLNFALESKSAGRDPHTAFDFFHINSVDKDDHGNYVISARHMHSIFCISARDPNKILWALGGKNNRFYDLSDGRATDFAWQHHARLHANYTMTIFDNAKSESIEYIGEYSRGLLLQIDTTMWTVELLGEYADPSHRYRAQSQGSAQLMDNGHMFLGYGFLPSFAEFAPDGRLLCDVRLAPLAVSSFGMVTSYRAFKSAQWVGKPKTSPSVHLRASDSHIFVSWLGATEVDRWVLQGADWMGVERDDYLELVQIAKDGFETSFRLDNNMPDYLRVAALDKKGSVLKHSEVVSRKKGNAPASWTKNPLVFSGICLVAFVALSYFNRRKVTHAVTRIQAIDLSRVVDWWKHKEPFAAHEAQRLYED